MGFIPLDQWLESAGAPVADWRPSVRVLATDMDGTLTTDGCFRPALLRAFEDLAAAGIVVLVVTGRSAGWTHGLAKYLPVAGTIAENGGWFYASDSLAAELGWSTARRERGENLMNLGDGTGDGDVGVDAHRDRLAQTFGVLKRQCPKLETTGDNRFRLTDWTFDVAGVTDEELGAIADRCRVDGWGFTYSTVQGHILSPGQNKAIALRQVLDLAFEGCPSDRVVTVGDSPNDAPLFDLSSFPRSVGVANVLDYRDELPYAPAAVTAAAEGEGFCELVRWLLAGRP